MFRRHPFKWLAVAAVVGFCFWLRFRTVPVLPGDHLKKGLESLAAGEFSSAEQHFRKELQLVPEQPAASEQLALVLIRSGRGWEASPYVRTTLSQHKIRQDYLIQFAVDPDQAIDESLLNEWHRQSPEDPAPLIGLARTAFRNGKTEEAHKLLDRILAASPNELEAHVIKGHAELATSLSRLPHWNQKLPRNAEIHPGIWSVRGDWCQQAGDPEMATRCFLEGMRLNPDDLEINQRLGQLLGEEKGQPFLERAAALKKSFDAVAQMRRVGTPAQAWRVLESLYAIGRFKEAAQWGQIAMTSDARLMFRMTSDRDFADNYRSIIAAAESNEDLNPVRNIDLKTFPEWHPPAGASAAQEVSAN